MSAVSIYLRLSFLPFFIVLLLAGCSSVGPNLLPQNRENFNAALLRSDEEQLVLNIVRMQYGDRPYFLGIDNVTLSNSVSLSAAPSYSISASHNTANPNPGGSVSYSQSLAPSASFSDSPTVVFSPLQGEKFTQQMLTPISIDRINLLIQSGWSIARVLRITTQRMGPLENAIGASRPSTKHIPQYQEFVRFAHYLRRLQIDEVVEIVPGTIQNQSNPAGAAQPLGAMPVAGPGEAGESISSLDILIHKRYRNDPRIKKLLQMLGINKPIDKISFVEANIENPPANIITLEARSFISILYYLSKSVNVTHAEIKKGLVVVPTLQNGKYFDWSDVTSGMLKIHSAKAPPKNATVAVFYHGRWYYILDNDVDSKESIALVEQLFSLQAGQSSGTPPVLTLNV